MGTTEFRWNGPALVSSGNGGLALATATPRKAIDAATSRLMPARSSRALGFTNRSHYHSFTRIEDGVRQDFAIGDVVTFSKDAARQITQSWLRSDHLPLPSMSASSKSTKSRGKGKRKMKMEGEVKEAPVEDARATIDDGLEFGAMVGVIIDLFDDEENDMRVKVHWLIRPLYLFSTWQLGELEALLETRDLSLHDVRLLLLMSLSVPSRKT